MDDRVNPLYDGSPGDTVPVRHREEEQPIYLDRQQVFLSMVKAGAEAGLRRPRLVAAGLALLAVVLLLVDINLAARYNVLTGDKISFDDMTHIHEELVRLHDEYKISVAAMASANRDLTFQTNQHQLSKWELDHQTKLKVNLDAQTDKLNKQISTLQQHFVMTITGCKRCPPEWIFTNSLCYYFPFAVTAAVKSWQTARDFCTSYGGDLAVIDNREKQLTISGLLEMNVDPSVRYSSRSFWIGLREAHHDGTWKWLNGKMLTDAYWSEGEPSNGDYDCAVMTLKTNPFEAWRDGNCDSKYKWICEMTPRRSS